MKLQIIKQTLFKRRLILLVGLVFFIYLSDNALVKSVTGQNLYQNVFQPLMWIGVGLIIWWFPVVRAAGKLRLRKSLCLWAINFAIIMITVQVLAGFLDGFGKSPYSNSFLGILINFFTVCAALAGRELTRHVLVNSWTRKQNYKVLVAVALLMTVIVFPISKYTELKNIQELVQFVAQYFAPQFTKNLLATCFAFYGGPLPAIIFMGVLDFFHWFSPVLPNLKWITAALIGILTPVFLFSALERIYLQENRIRKHRFKSEEGLLGWMVTTLISITIIWFTVGVFPVYPSVIATGSMIPMIYPGDVILVDKGVDRMKMSVGTVIQFQRDDILISHRIIGEVVEKDGTKHYLTKGDNNNSADSQWVKPEDIKGEVVKVVPKIGWPTLLLKSDQEIWSTNKEI
ncbi:signal peptidase I [Dehalobacter sp. 14DCB1]|uniref:signal peptidase I n=2 Tax=unclassified Dehalobacter TaxID=2635733 RepID=UPI000E6BDF89|nr:signal peptidase I [Dehalobacter sp. 14DCB1]RJE49097.1 signal peptidase I [Dehalobacter sp. MCB1]TCX47209.1 signal peptidase I [Dehalobacter sp. 14DCB1]TCX55331.1 signal peptidase I [Dehalobacter sp. 12DCB1]